MRNEIDSFFLELVVAEGKALTNSSVVFECGSHQGILSPGFRTVLPPPRLFHLKYVKEIKGRWEMNLDFFFLTKF